MRPFEPTTQTKATYTHMPRFRRRKAALILFLVAGFLPSVARANKVFTVLASKANLRQAPNPDAKSILQLGIGTEVRVVRTKGAWIEVKTKKQQGWVFRSLLTDRPLTTEFLLKEYRQADNLKTKRSWAERAVAWSPKDPRALGALVATLKSSQDSKALRQALAGIQTSYQRRLGSTKNAPAQCQAGECPWKHQPQKADVGLSSWLKRGQLETMFGGSVFVDEKERRQNTVRNLRPLHPKFIAWAADFIDLPLDPQARAWAKTLYVDHLQHVARKLYQELHKLRGASSEKLALTFRSEFARGHSRPKWDDFFGAIKRYKNAKERDLRGFWIRRYLEGTGEAVAALLEKVLVLYDEQALYDVLGTAKAPTRYFPKDSKFGIIEFGFHEKSEPAIFHTPGFVLAEDKTELAPANLSVDFEDIGISYTAKYNLQEDTAFKTAQDGLMLFGPYKAGPLERFNPTLGDKTQKHQFAGHCVQITQKSSKKMIRKHTCANAMLEEGQERTPDEPIEVFDLEVNVDGKRMGTLRRVEHIHFSGDLNRDGFPDFIITGPSKTDSSRRHRLFLSRDNGVLSIAAKYKGEFSCGC